MLSNRGGLLGNMLSHSIILRLQQCGDELNRWGQEFHNKFSQEIKECREQTQVFRGKRGATDRQTFFKAKNQLYELLDQCELLWK